MPPTLRNSTQQKTDASAKAAKDAGYTRRPRAPLSRKQRYTCNKGLVSMKTPKSLESISVANATESPLLRLPPEIRNMIFKFASQPDWSGWIGCYFNRRGCISRSGTSTRAYKSETRAFAIHLPQVCRQIYSETATLIYSENCFAFQSERAMTKWLSKRLLAQREAIRYMMLPYFVYSRIGRAGEGWAAKRGRDMVMTRAKLLCPNLVEMEEDDWLDECLTCTPAFDVQDWRSRERYPSSGDEGSQYGFSDSGW